MSDQLAASASSTVSKFLGDLCGMPVRLTILESDTRNRIFRAAGTLSRVKASSLTVECMRSVPAFQSDVAAAVEVMVNGSLIWFNTTLSPDTAPSHRGEVTLVLPDAVQTLQRRRHPRVDLDVPVQLVINRTGEGIQARVRDLSAGGTALRTQSPVSAGDEVTIRFPLASGMFFRDPVGVTLRCIDDADGDYSVAVQFACSPEQEARIAAWVNQRLEHEGQAISG